MTNTKRFDVSEWAAFAHANDPSYRIQNYENLWTINKKKYGLTMYAFGRSGMANIKSVATKLPTVMQFHSRDTGEMDPRKE